MGVRRPSPPGSAPRVGHPRLGLLLQLLAPAVGQAELGCPGPPDGEDEEGAGQGGGQECDGDGNLSVRREELDPDGAGVLHNEVDQGRAFPLSDEPSSARIVGVVAVLPLGVADNGWANVVPAFG